MWDLWICKMAMLLHCRICHLSALTASPVKVHCFCSTHNAITMHPVNQSTGEIIMDAEEAEAAGLGQAYSG